MSLLIAVLSLSAFSCLQVTRCRVSLADTIPFNFCTIMVILYFLAFFNALSFIDYIGVISFAVIAVLVIRNIRRTPTILSDIKHCIIRPSSLCVVLTIICLLIGMRNTQIVFYDDFKFWAATVKSLIYQDGYGAPYTNVGSEFGDYPQGMMLILWWGEHIIGSFDESILYISFTILALSFLFPLISDLKHVWQAILFVFVIIIFSSAFTRFGTSFEPDRIMAVAYGAALVSAIRFHKTRNTYYFFQFTLIASCITLLKSVGILWGIFACIFLFLISRKTNSCLIGAVPSLCAIVAIVVIYATWALYCGYYERTTYLTQEMFSSLSLSPREAIAHLKSYSFIVNMFATVIFSLPANCSNLFPVPWPFCGLSLTPIAYLILCACMGVLAFNKSFIDRATVIKCIVYCLLISILYYIILLWSYIFMFYSEFDPNNIGHMQNMTSHYAEPVLVGFFMSVSYMYLYHDKPVSTNLKRLSNTTNIIALTIILCANIPATVNLLFCQNCSDYYFFEQRESRDASEESLSQLVDNVSKVEDKTNSRVFIADDKLDGVGYCFAHYLLSPISTIDYTSDDLAGDFADIAESSHINYAYFGRSYSNELSFLEDLLDQEIQAETLYKVDHSESGIKLLPIE